MHRYKYLSGFVLTPLSLSSQLLKKEEKQ